MTDCVSAPTTNRHRRWDATNGLVAGDTSAVVAADTLAYKCIVETKAYAKDNYIRGVRGPGGEEMFYMFVTPQQMADLKLDSDFLANVRQASLRGNPAARTSRPQLSLWRIPEMETTTRHQSSRRQSRSISCLQPGPTTVGRQNRYGRRAQNLFGPSHCPKRLA